MYTFIKFETVTFNNVIHYTEANPENLEFYAFFREIFPEFPENVEFYALFKEIFPVGSKIGRVLTPGFSLNPP